MKKLLVVAGVTGLVFSAGLTGPMALPQYAAKEKMPCSTCHVKPSGGKGLTPKGKEYAKNGHSFKAGANATVAPKPSARR